MTPIEVLRAPNIEVRHGFTTRSGGVSEGPFASLNLGLSSGDVPEKVEANRDIVLKHFGVSRGRVCAFNQVHGTRVIEAAPAWFDCEADGAVTDEPGLLLVVSAADCAPILFHDPERGVVGAAHSGWRGTVNGIAAEVVRAMRECYGSRPEDIRVAIGPCISGPNYEVGAEVAGEFARAGFPDAVARPEGGGRFRLDLVSACRWLLAGCGVQDEHVFASGLCTYADSRFYSHRRDHGRTGRHWGAIRM